jgi:hypothetical protein
VEARIPPVNHCQQAACQHGSRAPRKSLAFSFLRFRRVAGPGVSSLAYSCDVMSLRVSLPKSQGYIKVWRPCAGNLALALFHSQTSRDLLLRRILHDIHFKALSPSLVQVRVELYQKSLWSKLGQYLHNRSVHFTTPDIFNSRDNSSSGSKFADAQGTTHNDASDVQKATSMIARFLEETAKDGHFTGLDMERNTLKKGAGKTKL